MKTLLLLLAIVGNFANAAKPKPVKAPPPPSAPAVFHVRLSEDMGTLDWNYGEVNPEIQYQIMEGLFRGNNKGLPVHAAASAHFWNKDRTLMRIQISPDRRWSDGAPLCAQQFIDSWARLADPAFASPYAHYASIIRKMEATSCRELKVYFTRPSPEAPALFSHYTFFPIRLEQVKKDPMIFRSGKGLLVNGPFQVKSWNPSQAIELEPNPDFGGKKAELAGVEFLFVPDDGTAQVLFEQKKIDWLKDVPPLLRTAASEKLPSFRVFPSFTAFYFGLNQNNSELVKNPVVRNGLFEALDRRQIPLVLGKEFQGTRAWLLSALFPDLKVPSRPTAGIEPAKKILTEAQAAGKMDLKLQVYDRSSHRLLAEWAQGQWEKNLGVRIPIEVTESKSYWHQLASDPPPIFLSGVTAPYAHPRALMQEFLAPSTANWTSWKSSEYDVEVAKGSFQAAEDRLRAAGYVIPLYRRDTVALVQPHWKDFYVNPLGQVYLQTVH
jgi:oligopeptide transport system substrate-binding protein